MSSSNGLNPPTSAVPGACESCMSNSGCTDPSLCSACVQACPTPPLTSQPPASETLSTFSPPSTATPSSSTESVSIPSLTSAASSSSPTFTDASLIASASSSDALTISPTYIPGISQAATKQNNHIGPIVGGAIGGFILLILIVFLFFYRKRILTRIRERHTAPSAEFRNRHFIPSAQYSPTAPILTTRGASMSSDEEQPPPFTPGNFSDPVYEKLNAAAAQREEFFSPYRDLGDSKFVGGSSGP